MSGHLPRYLARAWANDTSHRRVYRSMDSNLARLTLLYFTVSLLALGRVPFPLKFALR